MTFKHVDNELTTTRQKERKEPKKQKKNISKQNKTKQNIQGAKDLARRTLSWTEDDLWGSVMVSRAVFLNKLFQGDKTSPFNRSMSSRLFLSCPLSACLCFNDFVNIRKMWYPKSDTDESSYIKKAIMGLLQTYIIEIKMQIEMVFTRTILPISDSNEISFFMPYDPPLVKQYKNNFKLS